MQFLRNQLRAVIQIEMIGDAAHDIAHLDRLYDEIGIDLPGERREKSAIPTDKRPGK